MPPHLIVPDTWNTLEEFAQWFKDNGYPMRVPANMQIYVTDSTYSCIVFRQDVYQAELYMIAPCKKSSPHSHDFENLPIHMGGHVTVWTRSPWQWGDLCHPLSNITDNSPHPESEKLGMNLKIGESHNIDTHEQWCLMYVIQKWNDEEDMTSAVIHYIGQSMGPIHSEILLKK